MWSPRLGVLRLKSVRAKSVREERQVAREIKDSTDMAKATSGISRRGALTAAATLGFGAAGLGGGIGAAFAEMPAGGLPKKPFKFFFVCHVTLDQFFTP